jgi:hypothetical protein
MFQHGAANSQKILCISVRGMNHLVLFLEIIALCSENHKKTAHSVGKMLMFRR